MHSVSKHMRHEALQRDLLFTVPCLPFTREFFLLLIVSHSICFYTVNDYAGCSTLYLIARPVLLRPWPIRN